MGESRRLAKWVALFERLDATAGTDWCADIAKVVAKRKTALAAVEAEFDREIVRMANSAWASFSAQGLLDARERKFRSALSDMIDGAAIKAATGGEQ